MSPLKTACASLAILALAGSAYAMDDAMGHMTKSQMHAMTKCQAMSHDAMMKNHKCAAMMKMHPEMMKGDSAMGHDAMSHDAMSH